MCNLVESLQTDVQRLTSELITKSRLLAATQTQLESTPYYEGQSNTVNIVSADLTELVSFNGILVCIVF